MTRFFISTAVLVSTGFLTGTVAHGQTATDSLNKNKTDKFEFETENTFRPNGLFFNFTQLGIGEINLEYEKFIFTNRPRLSLNGAIGYRFFRMGGLDEGIGTVHDNGWADLWGYFWSQSIYASVSTKIYKTNHTERKFPYTELSLFFRDNFFDKVLVHYGKQHDNGINTDDRLQSSNEKVYGIKMIWGIKRRSTNSGRVVFSKNWFIGFGLRAKYVHKTTFEESPNPAYPVYGGTYIYNPPKQENYWTPVYPSLQAGLKLGWDWKRK